MESLLLFRRALSSPTMCRFIPALPVPSIAEGTPAMLVGRCSSDLSGHRLQGNLKSHSLRAQPRESALSEVEWDLRFSPLAAGCTWKRHPPALSSRSGATRPAEQ